MNDNPNNSIQLGDIEVHGGITFVLHGDGKHLYGFHTAHYDDLKQWKPKGWVIDETARLADSLLEWAKQHD